MVVNNDKICDINAQNYINGDTALHLSISKEKLFLTLMNKFNEQININIHNNNNIVPLMNAAEYIDNNKCLDALLLHPTLNIYAVDKNGYSTLHRIVIKPNTLNNFTKLLNHENIDINLQSNVSISR